MRTFLALIAREVRERRHLLAAALALGVLAWLAAWMPHSRSVPDAEVRSSVALLASAVLAAAAAVALGASMISRSLAEGRLAFYYVRPVPAAALWGAKTATVLLLLAAAIGLVWLPAVLAGGDPARALDLLVDWPEKVHAPLPAPWDTRGQLDGMPWIFARLAAPPSWSPGPFGAWLGLALVLLVLVSHFVSTALRSRSALVLADLVAFALALGVAWSAAARLARLGAVGTLLTCGTVVAVVLAMLLFAAGLTQMATGRTDPRRAHAVASLTLWGGLIPVLAGCHAAAWQVSRCGLGDLAAVTHLVPAPRGEWVVAAGPVAGDSGYAPVIAYHPGSGERRKIDVLQAVRLAPVFAADGRSLAWESCRWPLLGWRRPLKLTPRCEIRYLDLGTPAASPVETGIGTSLDAERPPFRPALALDVDGRRLAVFDAGRVAVYEMPSASTLAAAALPDWRFGTPRFADGRVRIHRPVGLAALEIWELDPATPRLTERGRLPGAFFRSSAAGDRIAVWPLRGPLSVFRTSDLAAVLTLGEASATIRDVRFLPDGGILVAAARRLSAFDAAGEPRWTREFFGLVSLGQKPSPGRIWVGVSERYWESQELDLATGDVVARHEGLLPSWHEAAPGSPAARLLMSRRGVPHAIDEKSGQTAPLFEISEWDKKEKSAGQESRQ